MVVFEEEEEVQEGGGGGDGGASSPQPRRHAAVQLLLRSAVKLGEPQLRGRASFPHAVSCPEAQNVNQIQTWCRTANPIISISFIRLPSKCRVCQRTPMTRRSCVSIL